MPDYGELRRVLEPHTQADVTQTYQRFRETTRSEDLGQFVSYLVAQGLLAPAAAPNIEAELRAAHVEPTIVERRGTPSSGGPTAPDSGMQVPNPRQHPANLRLLEVIGRGGMGVVFRGEQLELGRPIAFKQLLSRDSASMRERFVREARITAQLDHPNIVPVHLLEMSPDGSTIGYAMKLVEGKTLKTLLGETSEAYEHKRPIDGEHALSTRLEHFLKICDALSFAHDRGILHRDLKPANFMIGKFGEVYVMDWGVARPMGGPEDRRAAGTAPSPDPQLTQVGDVIGSPSYMSPEQADARNDELDARADQYALGLILFEMVSLRRAVDGNSTVEVFNIAVAGGKAPLVHVSHRERIPAELRAIVAKATAFAREDRYPSVQALADDVRRYMRGDAVIAKREGAFSRVWRWMSKRRKASAVAVLAALALAGLTVVWTLYRNTQRELAARRRGEAVTALYGDVANQAHHLDGEFQKMEAALEGLRSAAEWALTAPEPPASASIYFETDFADPKRRPKDFTDKSAYRWPVSVDQLVVGVAPGTDRAAVLPKVRRLAPLTEHVRSMVISAAGRDPAAMSEEQKREVLLQRRGPIDYAYVDLPEGVHFVYPGIDSLPAGYDVRTSGFYKMSENRHGRRWGSPYIDSTTDQQGDDLVLPCTQGLWSKTGEFLGVAGVEITVTKIVETGLSLPNRATLRTSLLNGDGKKVIDSTDAGKRFQASGKDEGLALFDFDIPEVVSAVKSGTDGLRKVRRKDRDELVVFVRLDVLGWYYVVEVDAATLDSEMKRDESPIISIKGLTKRYASGFEALKSVDLDIRRGEIFALLGPNGAGKTTLISVVCGIVNPTEGVVFADGHDIVRDYRAARAKIGLVPQELNTDAFESVWATIKFSRGLFGKPADAGYLEKVLRDLSLWDKRHDKIMTLSGGMKRRVMIAKALAHEPRILFLDEPTAGVDVELRRDMWSMVRGLRETGVTIILTTHYIEEAEEMADRVGVIARGELILVEDKATLMTKLGKRQLTVTLERKLDAIPPELACDGLELGSDGKEMVYTFGTQDDRYGVPALLKKLEELGIAFTDLETTQSSLEDIFIRLVRADR